MKQCVLLVDHGSRRAEANQATEALAKKLETTLGQRVLATHMELADPEYAATLAELAEDHELTSLTVLPLFFVEGKHWREDIEVPLQQFAEIRPDVDLELTPPVAVQPDFVEYLAERVRAT